MGKFNFKEKSFEFSIEDKTFDREEYDAEIVVNELVLFIAGEACEESYTKYENGCGHSPSYWYTVYDDSYVSGGTIDKIQDESDKEISLKEEAEILGLSEEEIDQFNSELINYIEDNYLKDYFIEELTYKR